MCAALNQFICRALAATKQLIAHWGFQEQASMPPSQRDQPCAANLEDGDTLVVGSSDDEDSESSGSDEEDDASLLDLWPEPERRRLEVALESLLEAAAWESLKHFRVQPQGTEIAVLQEISADVLGELSCMNSSISDDEELLERLQAPADESAQTMSASPSAPADNVDSTSTTVVSASLDDAAQNAAWARRQALAVRYRLERQRLRRALVGLLAVLRHAWGDSELLNKILHGKVQGL